MGSNPSFIWSSLIHTQDIIRKHSRWRVGNGSQIKIWTDDWLPDKENPKICSFPYPLMEEAKVEDLIVPGDCRWDEETIRIIFSERDANLIMSIPLPKQQMRDHVIWVVEDDGKFTVKSCYKALRGELRDSDSQPWTDMWQLKLPPKTKVFFWQACSNSLPTKDLLRQRKVECDVLCAICGNHEESIGHLFVECEYARACWRYSRLLVGHSVGASFQAWVNQNLERIDKANHCLFVLICWEIWGQRNDKCWNNSTIMHHQQLIRKAHNFLIS